MFDHLRQENGSVILFNVLVIVLIVFVLAMSLSRQVNLDLSLTEYSLAKQKARYAAWAGWLHSMALLKENHIKEIVSQKDVLRVTDEESKINLNAINSGNYNVVTQLLVILGLDTDTADQTTSAIVNWLAAKNRPFDDIDELLLIKGITPELFKKLKDFVTIFPKDSTQFSINLNTAPVEVISALGRSLNGVTNTDPEDADSLAGKIDDRRKGENDQLELNAKEKAIYSSMQQYTVRVSSIYRIKVEGKEGLGEISSVIEGVVTRKDYSILSWEQD